MRITLLCDSLLSDYNQGAAHLLRGVLNTLARRGHETSAWEPARSASVMGMIRSAGCAAADELRDVYPRLRVVRYGAAEDLDAALEASDLVWVHESAPAAAIEAVGNRRARGGRFAALYHDTSASTDPCLDGFDGVLTASAAGQQRWRDRGWGSRSWVLRPAVDTTLFRPRPVPPTRDLVWIGNWRPGASPAPHLVEPSRRLNLTGSAYGVGFPAVARRALGAAGLHCGGWLPNFRVPDVLAHYRATVYAPRRSHDGPPQRLLEALACGIPVVRAGARFDDGLADATLHGRTPAEVANQLRALLHDPALVLNLRRAGRRAVLREHTVDHRTDELLAVARVVLRGANCAAPRSLAHHAA